jgi:hypothetical protein
VPKLKDLPKDIQKEITQIAEIRGISRAAQYEIYMRKITMLLNHSGPKKGH